MNYDLPQAIFDPPKAQIVHEMQVGRKCRVSWLPDGEGDWIESCGLTPPEGAYVDMGDCSPYKDSDSFKDEAPDGRCSLDRFQARVFFRFEGEERNPVCRVILPEDAPFRACRKGMRSERSKSFDQEGNPVPEVRLLHALKTGRLDDRARALLDFSTLDIWPGESLDKLLAALDNTKNTDHGFRLFVGIKLANAATKTRGLSDWLLWEKVADDAAAFTLRLREMACGRTPNDNHGLFVRAVEETTIEFEGLAAQCHVRKRWEALGGIGEWKEIRKTLGFEWIPAKTDWERCWRPTLK